MSKTGGVLGVDVGLTGALALYRAGTWVLLDMPIVGDGKRHELNGPALCSWLREQRPDHAFVEYAAARPGQGVSSMFKFGCVYGATKMALSAVAVPYTVVTPARWKLAVGVPTGADKEGGRQRALQLFPDQAPNLARKRDHARSDAMLIAYFGMGCGVMTAKPRSVVELPPCGRGLGLCVAVIESGSAGTFLRCLTCGGVAPYRDSEMRRLQSIRPGIYTRSPEAVS